MKLKLEFEDLADEFFENTHLLGVVAPMKDYQFCWQLNQLLRFDFRLNPEIEIQLHKKSRKYYFSVFEFREKHGSLTHYLYNNQFDGEYLLPEFRHLDYLWLMKGDITGREFVAGLVMTLKSLPAVQLVMEPGEDQLKHKAHLIF